MGFFENVAIDVVACNRDKSGLAQSLTEAFSKLLSVGFSLVVRFAEIDFDQHPILANFR